MKQIDVAFLLVVEAILIFGSYMLSEMNKIPFWKAIIWFHCLIVAIAMVGFVFVYLAPKK